MQSTFAKRQFESVVFCTLHTFTIFYAVIYFFIFILKIDWTLELFYISRTRLVELVTCQGLHPWINRPSLPCNLKPSPKW